MAFNQTKGHRSVFEAVMAKDVVSLGQALERMRVTISHGRRGRLSFRCSIKKSAVVWENEERLPVK